MENHQRVDVTDHFNQQIEICKKLGCEEFFISQEARVGGRRLRALAKTMTKYTDYTWTVSTEPIQVTPNPLALQYVVSNTDISFDYTAE